jgi:hypothetical protein
MLEDIAKERVLLKHIRQKCSKTSQPGVSIICATSKLEYIDNIFLNYLRCIYIHKELIIILNNNKLNLSEYKMKAKGLNDIRIFQLDESYSLGQCLNFGIDQSTYNYISKMDDDDYYGSYYLVDLMNVFKYTDAKITGKSTRFIYFEENKCLGIYSPYYENQYVYNVAGGTILFKKEIFDKIRFRDLNIAEDSYFLYDCNVSGVKIFSADKYNYVYMRNRNLDMHTWKVTSNELMNRTIQLFESDDFISVVTV